MSPSEYQPATGLCSVSAAGPPLELGAYTGSETLLIRMAPSLL